MGNILAYSACPNGMMGALIASLSALSCVERRRAGRRLQRRRSPGSCICTGGKWDCPADWTCDGGPPGDDAGDAAPDDGGDETATDAPTDAPADAPADAPTDASDASDAHD